MSKTNSETKPYAKLGLFEFCFDTQLISGLSFTFYILSLQIEFNLIFIDRFLFVNEIQSLLLFYYIKSCHVFIKIKHINEFAQFNKYLILFIRASNYSFNKSTSIQIELQFNKKNDDELM